MFYTFEGGEGAGKSVIIKLIARRLSKEGHDVLVTREPGGGVLSEKIRALLLEGSESEMDMKTEVLLFAASRREHIIEVIKPAIAEGRIVLCDRYVDSSRVYQGLARKQPLDEIEFINRYATDGLEADATFFLDVQPEVGLQRIEKNRREKNRIDAMDLDFHIQVQLAYQALHACYPKRIKRIDANQNLKAVARDVWEKLNEVMT